jgi:hypothetical protein
MDVIEQLGMLVDVPPPGLDLGLKLGDAVHDGHGRFLRLLVGNKRCLPCKRRSA